MSEYNELNLKRALTEVFVKSIQDPDFRNLALSDAIAAIKAVSDIELPAGFKFKFYDNRNDFVYSYVLPPVLAADATSEDMAAQMIRWSTVCTDPTTTFTWPDV